MLALGWGGHLGTAAAYSLTDPTADHTDQGIQYDQAGKKDLALKSFKAAVRYENTRPIGERLSNLGVIFMRMERFQESSSAMVEAMSYKVAGLADASTSEHIQGNWDNLMTNLDYQRIERPAMPTGAEEERAAGWAAKDDKSAAKQNKQQQKKKKKLGGGGGGGSFLSAMKKQVSKTGMAKMKAAGKVASGLDAPTSAVQGARGAGRPVVPKGFGR